MFFRIRQTPSLLPPSFFRIKNGRRIRFRSNKTFLNGSPSTHVGSYVHRVLCFLFVSLKVFCFYKSRRTYYILFLVNNAHRDRRKNTRVRYLFAFIAAHSMYIRIVFEVLYYKADLDNFVCSVWTFFNHSLTVRWWRLCLGFPPPLPPLRGIRSDNGCARFPEWFLVSECANPATKRGTFFQSGTARAGKSVR